ncbi:MAG: 16S rRNA (adenine(1518)-N(6)/adenine(1519)-N(6))-dimethyltransferase RsmA [Eubacterium sp.]
MDYNLCDYNTVNSILSKFGFTFSKALGQNFLIDDSVCPDMAQALDADADTAVLEVGPGIGVLTKELCRTAGKVVSVELDKRLYPVLAETLADYPNFELVAGDIMKMDLPKLFEEKFKGYSKIKVCANLPYYITSPVIMTLLESNLPIDEIEVMVQREAAQRLCARVGSREAGAVTVAVRYYGDAKVLFDVGRECFMPSPKVDSAVIKISLNGGENKYNVKSEKQFFAVVRGAFAQRRKTVANSLASSLSLNKEKIYCALEQLNLDKNIRAEKLRMEDFVNLSDLLFE